jgi:uncharacterized Zn-binding protein involved in type VI secretion
MPGVARVGVDAAGGIIKGVLAPSVLVNGAPVAVKGADVTGHGSGLHAGPVMVGASGTVFAEGIGVCRAGDAANCGDTASGSANVLAG